MVNRDHSKTLLAMVALNSLDRPELARIPATLRGRYPAAPEPSEVSEQDDTLIFRLGEAMAAISLMPAPIPWSELEGPCATAWWWPEATERLRGHQGHLAVALLGGAGTPLDLHILLTYLVAAVTEHADAAGVYWGGGTVVHEPAAFRGEAAELAPDNLKPHLWIDMRLEENDDGSLRFFTTGMEWFKLMELEVERCRWDPQELLEFCYNVISYLLARGAPIGDGETVGRSAEEQIPVRHARSLWDERIVMRLELEGSGTHE